MKNPGRLLRFLMVEDNEDHAELIRRNFSENGVTNPLDHARDGEEAMKFLRKQPPYTDAQTPDVILLDLNLPKISGHEVLDAVKQDPALKKIPIIILSTSSTEKDRQMAYDLGANSFVVKPVDFEEFRKSIKELKFYWGFYNSPAGG